MGKVRDAVALAIRIAEDPAHGYDQAHRDGPDYDCSSLINLIWESVGVHVKAAGATYTGNMLPAYLKCGFIQPDLDVDDLSTGTGLMPGDVLLNEISHAAIYIGNGKIVQASINELGTTTGGQPGDQTGQEIAIRGYYNFPWTRVLRYANDTHEEGDSMYTIKPGDSWWSIANRELGDGGLWEHLMRLNGYTSPDEPIYAGQTIKLWDDECESCTIDAPTPVPSERLALRGYVEKIAVLLGGTAVWDD